MSYIKDTFTRFKSFISDIFSATSNVANQLSITNLKNLFKIEYTDLKTKLKDLKGTNWDLAQYHFVAGNHNDAIMRFKILQKNNYKLVESYYFLGRIYLEKNNKKKSSEYLNSYLSSKSTEYRPEAEYCIAVLNNSELSTIPDSIIKNKRNKVALNLERDNMDNSTLKRYYAIINILRSEMNQNEKILEVGCYIGVLGRILRDTFAPNIQYFEGTEIGEKAVEVASGMHIGTSLVYDKITSCDNLSEIVNNTNTYSTVIVPDILSYYSDLPQIFLKLFILLNSSGTGLVVARVTKQDDNNQAKNVEFIHPVEEFRYAHSYILEIALSCGFQLKESYDIDSGLEAYIFKKV